MFGPFTSTQLMQWQRQGHMAGTWCRRVQGPEWARRKQLAVAQLQAQGQGHGQGQGQMSSDVGNGESGSAGDLADELAADLEDEPRGETGGADVAAGGQIGAVH